MTLPERSLTDIKLKDLRYLVAVADFRHFGRAAAHCFVSQPTLSMQMRKLEDYLGLQLIERQPRRVTLTPAGERIVERARRIIEASDEVAEIARAEHDPLGGRLRLALLPTVGPYLPPLVTQKLHRVLPQLELMLYEFQTAPMLEKLHAGELDVGVLALPVPLARSGRQAGCPSPKVAYCTAGRDRTPLELEWRSHRNRHVLHTVSKESRWPYGRYLHHLLPRPRFHARISS